MAEFPPSPVPNCDVIHGLALDIGFARDSAARSVSRGFNDLDMEQAFLRRAADTERLLDLYPDARDDIIALAGTHYAVAGNARELWRNSVHSADIFTGMEEHLLASMDSHAAIHAKWDACQPTIQDLNRAWVKDLVRPLIFWKR